ncbi:MAG: signal recognition particle-docking protein FtsY [Candidatus Bipolaricaulota bacterium]
MAWADRLRNGLERTRTQLTASITQVLGQGGTLDHEELEKIEEILISADVSAAVATELVDELSSCRRTGRIDREEVLAILKQGIKKRLSGHERSLSLRNDSQLTVILVAGVNGSGKTTTIAKLAAHLREHDPAMPITFAAADTFRAGAIDQLNIWADRVDADMIRHRIGADPSAVVFDAIEHARRRGGVLFIDTAGRLHTKHNLMEELQKINRTVVKRLGRKPDERLLILDATTGQNGICQAVSFHTAIDLTGVVLTKLDGTSKGGVILTIQKQLAVPIMYIGVGESKDDLHEFVADQFVDALFSA